jgi:hypothetical protein
MKAALLTLVLSAFLVSGAAASSHSSTAAKKQRPVVFYGHVKSVKRVHGRFKMRFDPALWLTGVAAESACGCKPVSNDYYILDESHRLLTFVVRRDARVTVLTRHGSGQIPTATISVAELGQIVAGKNPHHRQLLEPKAGFWIKIGERYPNPAISLDQQYQP